MNNIQTIFYNYVFIILFLLCSSNASKAKTTNTGNGILKKRVLERQASQKLDPLLEQFKNNSMQELVDSLHNMNKLLTMLQVSSIDLAIQKVETMQNDIQKLLAALDADSISAGIKQAEQVHSLAKQFSQLSYQK